MENIMCSGGKERRRKEGGRVRRENKDRVMEGVDEGRYKGGREGE